MQSDKTKYNYLSDTFHRTFSYVRLSVTDRCNFRCIYCLPNGYEITSESASSPELNIDEIRRLVTAFSQMGVKKVRLTGGEPTVRRDIVEIAHVVSQVSGIEKVAITTNAYRLKELAKPLRLAGVTSLNVSVDSLDPENFKKITGTDRLHTVMEGVEESLSLGFENIKLNAVLLKNTNDTEVANFMNWIRFKPISVRFIELMQTGKNKEFFKSHHISAGDIQFLLLKAGWIPIAKAQTDGPAIVYRHKDYVGSIGFITPYAKDFCKTCNRLRVTARGALKLCLFGENDLSLREYLQSDNQLDELIKLIQNLLVEKPEAHLLKEGKYGNNESFANIGG